MIRKIPGDPKMSLGKISNRQWNVAACILIMCLGAILYGHTLNVPFYYDDVINLVDKPVYRRDLYSSFLDILNSRGIANFTFALNYHFGELNLVGLHLVNIAIHILASCVVFGIFSLFMPGTPGMALTGALIFLAHPLQTQSVTYIIQRYTSLSGLLLFSATLLFCHACRRLNQEGSISVIFIALYAVSLIFGATAVYTKENAAVLPVLLVLAVYFFIDQQIRFRKLVVLVAPFTIAPLYQIYVQIAVPIINRGGTSTTAAISSLSQTGDAAVSTATPITYLVTEFGVLWIYIRLLFLPVKQALLYNYPMVKTLFGLKSIMAFIGIMLLFAIAFLLRKKQKLIACGILWFFVGLAVESTFIPLDPVFEHRLYIPLFGFALVAIGLIRMIPARGIALAISILLIGSYGILTWQRNALWSDEIAFYEDNLKRAPGRVWLYLCLGTMYIEKKQYERAEKLLNRAIELRPNYFKAYNNLATLYDLTGRPEQALAAYTRAATIDPTDAKVHTNMGAVFAGLKRWDEAIAQHTIAISLKPDYALAYFNLGVARYSTGDTTGALDSFRIAAELAPSDEDTLYNMALISAETGDLKTALQIVTRLTAINPERGAKLAIEVSSSRHN